MTGHTSRKVALKNIAWTLPELIAVWWATDKYGVTWGILFASMLTLYVIYQQMALARSLSMAFHLKEEAVLQAILTKLEISREDVATAMLSYTTEESRAAIEKIFDDVGL